MDFGRSIHASNGMHQVLFVTSLEHNAGPSRLPSGLSSIGHPEGSNEFESVQIGAQITEETGEPPHVGRQ